MSESPLDLALLAILGDFKSGEIDFRQAVTEIKQAFTYHRERGEV